MAVPLSPALKFASGINPSVAGIWRAAAQALAVAIMVLAAIAGLYLVKSALGINLLSGHSPLLHAMLYPLLTH